MAKSMIVVKDIVWSREGKKILDEVSWTVNEGEHWAVLGLNGSGKTSLLRMITGYEWPTKGSITVFGETFGKTYLPDLRKRIGWVSTKMDERFLSKQEALAIEVVISGKYATIGLFEKPTLTEKEQAFKLLKQLKIDHLAEEHYGHLSQGEKRRVSLARALMASPELLILDEPCNGLDVFAREQLLDTIQILASQKQGPTIIYVTHHIEEIVPAISHALLLHRGKVIKEGEKEWTLTAEKLTEALQVPVSLAWEDKRPWLRVREQ